MSAIVLQAGVTLLPERVHAQPLPASTGRTIEASDGDVIVLPHTGQVSIVRRSMVTARLVYVEARRTLLLLTDPPVGVSGPPGAKGFRRFEITGPWPLEPRWEGTATIDEYLPWSGTHMGVGIHVDRGLIFIGLWRGEQNSVGPRPLAVFASGSTSSRPAWGSFDDIEQAWMAGGDDSLGGARVHSRLSAAARSGSASASGAPQGGAAQSAPVRVGGNVKVPTKVLHVDPVYPATARAAGVSGVVILEVTIGEDGAVADARVLRSIPLLDTAALDAVRQWRYEPTLLNGVPTPVLLTATVNFMAPPP